MSQHGAHGHDSSQPPDAPPSPGSVNWRLNGVRVIKADQLDSNTAQTPGMNRAAAINAARVGAQKIWAGTVNIHPNAKTGAHHHGALESVIYVLRGKARMRWGEHLEFVAEADVGDFIFVPPLCHIRRSMPARTRRWSAFSSAATTKRSWSTWTSSRLRNLKLFTGSTPSTNNLKGTCLLMALWGGERRSSSVERGNDHRNALGVPSLDRLVIGAQGLAQPAPRKQVPVGNRMDEASRANHATEYVAVNRYQRNPAHRLVHAGDLPG